MYVAIVDGEIMEERREEREEPLGLGPAGGGADAVHRAGNNSVEEQ